MGIIFKYLIRNIIEKKFRTFLILISIIASGALFFGSLAISNTFETTYLDRLKSAVGNAEIMVVANEKSPSQFFYVSARADNDSEVEYQVGRFLGNGAFKISKDESININLNGYKLESLNSMNPVIFEQKLDSEKFTGNEIIISKKTSQKYNLKLGDRIPLIINGIKQNFYIWGIAEPFGIFRTEVENTEAIVPIDTISAIYGQRGAVNTVFIKTTDTADKLKVMERLSKIYKNCDVRETFDQADLSRSIGSVRTTFLMMLLVVLFMSIFIIYSVFKIITLERLPVLGTFRSVGATKTMTTKVLLGESLLYGLIGGILGDFAGIGALYLMADVINPYKDIGIKASVNYTMPQLIYAFLMAVSMSVLSSMLPVLRVSRIPVKDIVLNNIERQGGKKSYKLYLGLIFLVSSIIIPLLHIKQMAILIDGACLVMSIFSLVLLIPYITSVSILILQGVYGFIFGNEGILAVKNLRNNKSILNNITLLTIGISAIFMINTISFSFGKTLVDAYSLYKFDIFMAMDNADKSTLNLIEQVKGVTGVQGVYAAWNVKVGDTGKTIMETDGINSEKFMDFLNVNLDGDPQKILKGFNDDRNIIITKVLKNRFDLNIGDNIILNLPKGKKTYKVVGVFDTQMQDGSYAFIPERYFKLDTGQQYYDHITIRTDENVDNVKSQLLKEFIQRTPYVREVREFKKDNEESFQQIMSILTAFSGMAVLIGIFGVLNNFIISFIERKRALAVLASVGMSKRQTIKMLFIEALTIGLIGGIVGVCGGVLLSSIVPQLMEAMDSTMTIEFSKSVFVTGIFSGILVSIAASLSPAIKSSKLNIIEAVKYE